jgi:PAS domain S-box-containing protein
MMAEQIGQIGYWRVELPDERVTWSAEVFNIFGFDPADGPPAPRSLRERYHPDDRERMVQLWTQVRETGCRYEFEARIIRPNGEVRTIHARGGGETDATGAVRAYFGVITDITERKRVEAAQAESEARYRLLAEHSSDLIILGHNDGRRSYISPAVHRMLGYTVEEAHALTMRDFVHPDDLGRVFETTRRLSSEAPQDSVVYRLRHKDGHYIWAEAAFQRVETEGDITIVTAIRDVTERQRQAEETKRAKEAAEEAKARAELANQAKTEFLASMSHEIRTPLAGILGYADLLITRNSLDPEQRQHVERIQSAGSALLTIVDDILDFSKIEAGEIVLEPGPFSPRGLVEDAVSIVRSVADRKSLPIHVEIDPGLPTALVGDEARLRQVLLNLLNNAVKFTRRGHVALTVAHRTSPDGETVTFRVEDTGIGIPQEKQERLFKRFSQVDGAINREFGGTGLGLAISKQLVDMMGGSITVESEAGKGSAFSFAVTLPQAQERVAAEPPLPSDAALRAKAHILLVEDLDINQELGRAVLEAAGHRVDVVADGIEAIAAVQEKAYDLVLMDVQMPRMDGLTATQMIRGLRHPARNVPIIAMTANVLPQQVTACHKAGMTDHIGKPFKRDELYAAVERALRGLPAEHKHERSSATPALDDAVLADLADVGGAELVKRLVEQLDDDFKVRFDADGSQLRSREEIMRDAHALVSSAGMLGLMQLSEACMELERACQGEGEIEALLARVRRLGAEGLDLAKNWTSRA